MAENEKKNLTTEEELRRIFRSDCPETEDEAFAQVDRLVDLIIDLIAERSEEKAEERVDQHEREWDHSIGY